MLAKYFEYMTVTVEPKYEMGTKLVKEEGFVFVYGEVAFQSVPDNDGNPVRLKGYAFLPIQYFTGITKTLVPDMMGNLTERNAKNLSM